MIRASVREWGYIPIEDSGAEGVVTRGAADALLAAARLSRVGGPDGEAILTDGHSRLRAQQVVGVLATPDATLEILPKIDGLDEGATRRNLVHMLAQVFDLEVSDGALSELGCQRDDLLQVLIRLFCEKLFQAVHRGLPRRYIDQSADLPALRGRLDVTRQFTVLAATPHRLACRYDELSADIPLNQVMKAAVSRMAKLSRAAETQRRLAELGLAFADVSAVPPGALPWDSIVMDRTNASWATLLSLARLLLGDRFQTTSFGQSQGFALLFEMNTLFEEFVGRMLRRALSGTRLEVRLQGPRDHVLEDEAGAKRFATKPDIVVLDQGRPVLVIDTKWKRLVGAIDDPKHGVGHADVYQMMAYAHVYGCRRLMLLYPHHLEVGPNDGVVATHRVRGADDVRLAVASIGLGALVDIEARLGRLIEGELST